MQTLLTKVVDLRNAGCLMARQITRSAEYAESNERAHCTDYSRRGCDTSDIHLSVGGPRPFEVPGRELGQRGERRHKQALRLTNLMATVCELRRFVPSAGNKPGLRERTKKRGGEK